MDKVKTGVVGLGVGNWNIRAFNSVPNAETIAVCDTSEARLNEAKERYHFKDSQLYKDYDTMIDKSGIDAVAIAAPNWLHVPFAIKAAERGIHVLLQKPVARNLPECDKMIDACRKAKVILMPQMMHIWFPESRVAKRLIDGGAIGEVRQVKQDNVHYKFSEDKPWWYGYPEQSGGGALMDIGVHGIYLLKHLLGDFSTVSANLKTYTKEVRGLPLKVEDCAALWYKMKNGSTVSHAVSWCAAEHGTIYPRFGTEIYGSEGTILLHHTMGRLAVLSNAWDEKQIREATKDIPITLEPTPVGRPRPVTWWINPYPKRLNRRRTGTLVEYDRPQDEYNADIDPMHQYFVECILQKKDPVPSFEEGGRKPLEVIMAAYESHKKRKPITIPLTYDLEYVNNHYNWDWPL